MTRGLGTGGYRGRERGLAFDKCVNRVRRLCKSKPRCKKGHKWRGNRVSRGQNSAPQFNNHDPRGASASHSHFPRFFTVRLSRPFLFADSFPYPRHRGIFLLLRRRNVSGC